MTASLPQSPPLCVDLDGTLIKTDLLWESLIRLLKRSPWKLLLLPFWLLKGKAYLKHRLAEDSGINVAVLPYHHELIEYLKTQKLTGNREIILCTGSYKTLADNVSSHLTIFTEVIATENGHNLTGRNKAELLRERYGDKGFDYIGNEAKDRHIWSAARKALLVTDSSSLAKSVNAQFDTEKVFQHPRAGLLTYIKALRLHQWVKNLLIFIPLALDHRLLDSAALITSSLAFLVFGMIASGTYIINDLLDLDADRAHHKKSKRAFASGELSIAAGLVLTALMLGGGAIICAIFLPPLFALVVTTYLICTLLYSFKFKATPMLDVCLLAGLFTLRVIAGTVAIAAVWSFWLLAFSIFFFLSLALAKRSSELENLRQANKVWAKGRGYGVEDLPLINSMGVSSGFLSIMIIALYINSEKVATMYQRPEILWMICPVLLYWTGRVWLKTSRGEMHEDPIVFAIKDRLSWILAGICGLTIWLASLMNGMSNGF